MRLPKAKLFAPVLSLALAGALFLHMQAYASEDDAAPYHADIAEAAAQVPIRFGLWEGEEIQVPPAAGKLLRPNVLLSRRYTAAGGQRVHMVLVQCFDARDMSGHYPPNCYPGNGWTMRGETKHLELDVWGRTIPVAEYGFTRTSGARTISTVIYNFFVLPTQGFVTSMSDVREATGDYHARPYGAAQVQVIFDAHMSETERLAILREFLQPLGPVIERIQDTHTGENR